MTTHPTDAELEAIESQAPTNLIYVTDMTDEELDSLLGLTPEPIDPVIVGDAKAALLPHLAPAYDDLDFSGETTINDTHLEVIVACKECGWSLDDVVASPAEAVDLATDYWIFLALDDGDLVTHDEWLLDESDAFINF